MIKSFIKKEYLMLWAGLIGVWFLGRFLLTLSHVVIPSISDYKSYLIEGVIISSLAVIIVSILCNFNDRDRVKEKRIFGIRFIWHKKYLWWWFGMTMWWGIARSLIGLYHNGSSNVVGNFVKGAIFFALVHIGASLWEGNPAFFGGSSGDEKKE